MPFAFMKILSEESLRGHLNFVIETRKIGMTIIFRCKFTEVDERHENTNVVLVNAPCCLPGSARVHELADERLVR